ncbi:MAG: PEGA domain-containing protein [Deltaproteobacteria bacterium]|nr:PEGA domain-containing protein [Deltaproteobacteria bacterium]
MTRFLAPVALFLALGTPALAQEGAALPGSEPAPQPAPPAQPAALPAPAEPAALPAPAGAGSIEITTDQPAEAAVDGARAGKTPVRVDGLSPGVHRVTVTREGGAPVVRDVTVVDGQVSRVEILVAGAAPVSGGGSVGGAEPTATAPQASGGSKFSIPGREFFSTFLEQPWAWAAVAVCGVALLTTAVLWTTAGPKDLPLVGNFVNVDVPTQAWWALKISALVIAALSGGAALLMFVWPSLPFAKWVKLPDLSKMVGLKKDDAPAAAPAQPAPAK